MDKNPPKDNSDRLLTTEADQALALVTHTPPAVAAFNRQKACRYGQMLYNIHDIYVGRSLDLYGEFSEGEVEMFRQIVRPGDWVLDVGANIGAHTLFFARQIGPSGRVLAFEPQRMIFQMLCANMALNSVTNAWCYPQAVGAEAGEIPVPVLDCQQENNFGGLGLDLGLGGEPVPVIRLDGLRLARCDLIKIDVEGMERAVLAGAVQTIGRLKPVLYVENDRADRSAELVRFLDHLGYAMYWHYPPLYNPGNFFGNPENIFANTISANMLCIHRKAGVCVEGFRQVDVPGPLPRKKWWQFFSGPVKGQKGTGYINPI
jgi:FkbM family methyltransferase